MTNYLTLNKVCIKIVDCPHETPVWLANGIRVIRNFNLINGQMDFTDPYFVDEATFLRRTRRAIPEEGDIVFSREAPIGNCAIVPPNTKCCLGQRLVLLKVNHDICSSEYLLTVLLSSYVKQQISQVSKTGSIVSNFAISDLKELVIPLVDNSEDIAHFAELIRKKISINNAISNKLKEMIYKTYMHYFFRKEKNGKIRDILLEKDKSSIQVNEAKQSDGNYPFFTSGSSILRWNTPFVNGRYCYMNTGGNADVKFYVGKASYSTDTWCITGKDNYSDYLYILLESIKTELNIKFFQGTGLKHLQKDMLKERDIYIPSKNEINDFNNFVQPLNDQVSANTRENQLLEEISDFVIPMLMNGQLTIQFSKD